MIGKLKNMLVPPRAPLPMPIGAPVPPGANKGMPVLPMPIQKPMPMPGPVPIGAPVPPGVGKGMPIAPPMLPPKRGDFMSIGGPLGS